MSDLWIEEQMLIDGKLTGAASGKTFENINPTTEEVAGVVADGDTSDMDAAIGAARRAFDETDWSTNLELRLRGLRQLHDVLVKERDRFVNTVVTEVGAPIMLANMAQYDTPVGGIEWVTDFAEQYEWDEDLGTREVVPGMPAVRHALKEPIGVVGAITPWNYPVQINLAKAIPALAAGNTVVLKPAPDTPWSATLLGQIIAEQTDIPAGVFNVVTSSDHKVGEALVVAPARRHGVVHRLDGHGTPHHGGGSTHGEEGVPRARREVGGDRARRRRPRVGSRRRVLRGLRARRPGLRDDHTHARVEEALRRGHRDRARRRSSRSPSVTRWSTAR